MKPLVVAGITVFLCCSWPEVSCLMAQDSPAVEAPSVEPVDESSPPSAAPARMDDDHLDPSWFVNSADDERIEFRITRLIDYLWVRENLTFEGRQLHVDDWEATRLGSQRDNRDRAKAVELTKIAPELLLRAFEKSLKGDPSFSSTNGDVRIVGRFVDINAGRAAAFVFPNATFDIKLVDTRSGELLVAIHHRLVGRTKSKLKPWFKKLGKALQKDLSTIYEEGKIALE